MVQCTQIQPPATGSLSPRWQRVLRRFSDLAAWESRDFSHEQGVLLKWRTILDGAHGIELPAPWAFVGDDGGIELEWEIGTRFLRLRMCPVPELYEYSAVDEDPASYAEVTRPVDVQGVKQLLLWLAQLAPLP
jgi:hypothetical protein